MAHPLFIQDGFLVVADGAWFIEFRLVLLAGFVLAAAVGDLHRRRISNRLILCGLAVAFLWHLFYPYDLGWLRGLAGLAAGIGILLPFFLVRGMAAGDVKLMGLVGAFVGPWGVVWVTLLTFLLGGIWVVAWLTAKRAWPQVMANLWVMWQTLGLTRAPALARAGEDGGLPSVGAIPYGVAIAAGALLLVALFKQGWVLM